MEPKRYIDKIKMAITRLANGERLNGMLKVLQNHNAESSFTFVQPVFSKIDCA